MPWENHNSKIHMYASVHCSTSQDMEATQKSIGRQMDKEIVVHIYNRMLLSSKKEHIWISSNEMDETRAYYTVWIKPER